MSTITFDTHKFVKDLQASGVPEAQAEAFVRGQQEILAQVLDTTLATKSDIVDVKIELAKMDAKLDRFMWMVGILIAIAVANFAKQFF